MRLLSIEILKGLKSRHKIVNIDKISSQRLVRL